MNEIAMGHQGCGVELAPKQDSTTPHDDSSNGDSKIEDYSNDTLWNVYNTKAEVYDNALVERVRGSMDSILVFAGLFSAILTAFIIESYKSLTADSGDASAFYLALITQQLVRDPPNNITLPAIPSPPQNTTRSTITVNILWILSLLSSLTCALCATLIQSWAARYTRITRRSSFPDYRARERAFHHDGFRRSGMNAFAEVIPALLHLALFLFLAGLVVFFFPISIPVAYATLGVSSLCALAYLTFTVLPLMMVNSPYRTPLSPAAIDLHIQAELTYLHTLRISYFLLASVVNLLRFLLAGGGVHSSSLGRAWDSVNAAYEKVHSRAKTAMHHYVFYDTPTHRGNLPPEPNCDKKILEWLLSQTRTPRDIEGMIVGIEPLIETAHEHEQQTYAKMALCLAADTFNDYTMEGEFGVRVSNILSSYVASAKSNPDQRRRNIGHITSTITSIFAHTTEEERWYTSAIFVADGLTFHFDRPTYWEIWATDKTMSTLAALRDDPDPTISLHATCLSGLLFHRALSDVSCRISYEELEISAPASWDLLDIMRAFRKVGDEHHRQLFEIFVGVSIPSFFTRMECDDARDVPPRITCRPTYFFGRDMSPLAVIIQPKSEDEQDLAAPLEQQAGPSSSDTTSVIETTPDLATVDDEKFRDELVALARLIDFVVASSALATPMNATILRKVMRGIAEKGGGGKASEAIRGRFAESWARLRDAAANVAVAIDNSSDPPPIRTVLASPDMSQILQGIRDSWE